MSRLGDLIHTQRTRQNMTAKQVSRKCGVSETYILDVEAGKRIIADDQARRILKAIGLTEHTEADFTLDDIAATVDLETVKPKVQPPAEKTVKGDARPVASAKETVSGSIWLDALSSVLKRVPVYNAAMQEVGHRLLPITEGRIENASPDKVFYYVVPDDSMQGFRMHRDDLVLIVPAASPIDDAVMLIEYNKQRMLRKIKKLDGFQLLIQNYGREYDARQVTVQEITCLGRCVKIEISL